MAKFVTTLLLTGTFLGTSLLAENLNAQDRTMMQGFYWDATPGGVWYEYVEDQSDALGRAGFDAIWMPPPSKGAAGGFDVGYTPYDYYDLGEYDNQPGGGTGRATRYGTRSDLESMVQSLQSDGLEVYVDIVVNHRSGGQLEPNEFSHWYTDRDGGSLFSPDGDSTFTAFPDILEHGSGRIAWDVGDGNDFFIPNEVNNPDNTPDFYADNQLEGFHQMYINNFGYQNAIHDGAGNTLPLGDSLKVWGDWLTNEIGYDGYRFDFVKGVHPEYLKNWTDYGSMAGKFHVHELFDGDIGRLQTYLDMVSGTEKDPAVFDFNIRFAYKEWSDQHEDYDIRNLHDRGLYNHGVSYDQIVPFIDNHDTDRTNYEGEVTQEGHDPVVNHKDLIYAHMLTHPGFPQVWWRDYFYYGYRDDINLLTAIRNQFASGGHHILTARDDVYWPGFQPTDEQNVYVMQRDGVDDETGLIMAINKHPEFNIDVWVTNIRDDWRGRKLVDLTGAVSDTLQVEDDGRVLVKTQPESYSVFVPEDYDFEMETGMSLTSITGLLDDYLVDEEIQAGFEIKSESTLSEDFEVEFTVSDENGNEVISQTVEDNLAAGESRSFDVDEFSLSDSGTYTASAALISPVNSETVEQTFEVIQPDEDDPEVRVDGRMNDPAYRLMANRLNTNAGFGDNKTVDGIYFFDDADSIYIGVDGELVLSDDDGIGVMLDFTQRDGLDAGTTLGGVSGTTDYLNAEEDGFTMDFPADLALSLSPGPGNRTVLSIADYSGDQPEGFQVLPDDESAADGDGAVTGPLQDEVFPSESVTYAVMNSGRSRQGFEIAISKDALGVDGGEVRGFAWIVSNTAYFSNVTVPGNLEGDEDEFGNPGFNTQLHEEDGGPFVSSFLELGGEGEPLATPLMDFPSSGDFVGPEFEFRWQGVSEAQSYRIQATREDQDFSQAQLDEELSDTTYQFTADLDDPTEEWKWRVRAIDGQRQSSWSEGTLFTISEVLDTPVTEQPDDGDVTGKEIEFAWEEVPGAASYDIQVAETPDDIEDENTLLDESTSATSYTFEPDAETAPDSLAWRVRATEGDRISDWTDIISFYYVANGIMLTDLSGLLDSYLAGESINAGVEVSNVANSSIDVTVAFEITNEEDSQVHADTLQADIDAGEELTLEADTLSISQPGEYTATAELLSPENGDHGFVEAFFEVIEPDEEPGVQVDGRLTDEGYRLMASTLNNNAGFGDDKSVDAIYFYDDDDSVYIGIDGELILEDQDGIGVMLDFTEREGTEAGTALGGVEGATSFLNPDEVDDLEEQQSYTMDFDADLGLAFYGTEDGERIALSVADYATNAPSGFRVLPDDQSAQDGAGAVTGPVEDDVFPEGSVTYAVRNSGQERQGYEVAISKEALGVDEGQVRGFSWIVSNTAYFSNVSVPGNLDGDADDAGNPGFGAQLHEKDGGPFVSSYLDLAVDEEPLATPSQISPSEGDTVEPEFGFTWTSVADADSYRLQLDDAENGFGEDDPVFEATTSDTTLSFNADEEELDTDKTWVWRIQSEDGERVSDWSGATEFTIMEPILLEAPDLVRPVNAEYEGDTIEFEWSEVEDAEEYQLHIATSSDGLSDEDLLVDETSGETTYEFEPDADDPPNAIAWRVRSMATNVTSDWSDIAEFDFVFTSSGEDMAEVPDEVDLSQNYPNPFNPITTIEFALPEDADISLEVFDVTGRHVMELTSGRYSAGYHTVSFDGSQLSSGVYIYRLTHGQEVITRQMMLMK